MKVLKFGGSSVGSPEPLRNIKKIVEGVEDESIVVVSALGGVTDSLIRLSALAQKGDGSWKGEFRAILERHKNIVDEVFGCGSQKACSILAAMQPLFAQLESLCGGVCALKALPESTQCEILSFGERLSAIIVGALLEGSSLLYSPDFIKTRKSNGRNVAELGTTFELVRKAFEGNASRVVVVPGFIASDADGRMTTLGRGGSDYTASIIAAALDARSLEIWTDVDGFMTADPRIIKTSYVIDELSFAEAMELCNFGAKVVYAPALYPVCSKDIPVHIKNTFNPEAAGTVIRGRRAGADASVTGIASIDDICLLTLSGPSMVGIVGVDGRLFGALSRAGISVFLVSQSSSETGISVGVSSAGADRALKAVDDEFASEISSGAMHPASLARDLAAVAVVGSNMKHSKGVAGKLFTTLGRNGIGVLACAQGSSEYNISIIVERKFLRKSLNVIHDSFFLSEYQELNLFICGVGTVGGSLISQIASQHDKLMKENNLKINVVGLARSTRALFDRDGIDLADWKEKLAAAPETDLRGIRDAVIGMNIFNSVFVDCTANAGVADLYKDFFEHGISVVAANKIAASSEYSNYATLKDLARRRGVKFLFETNVGAGLPIINTINALRNSGDRILRIEAVVSGTLNFIFNTISEDIPFSRTVRMAKEQGYSEPDPRIDLSGKDVIRKLVILAREAGYEVNQEDVEANLFIPSDFFDFTMDEFWQKLPSLDADFEARRKVLEKERKHWRFVAKMEDGHFSVSLREFREGHSFYVLEGSNNIILLTTERYNAHPMLIQGYGAGADVTAAGVFADIMSIANV